ncbi:hypothetical protein DPQ33_01280 [Oceanidesulfovibrio indonesiensis]|uniref:Uncharacterized protein n=1 Tax=Oceanidesulfovibrio indonesiensis TaxID=54767 RepID=A0A7M3MJN5_9BACT|nr:hypothetical protein DPQ33_01280 [Oceanidesulfovibrio indonesiensis]
MSQEEGLRLQSTVGIILAGSSIMFECEARKKIRAKAHSQYVFGLIFLKQHGNRLFFQRPV